MVGLSQRHHSAIKPIDIYQKVEAEGANRTLSSTIHIVAYSATAARSSVNSIVA